MDNIEESMEEIHEIENDEQEYTVEELLISCVMARPPLWDSRLSIKESSKTTRNRLWEEIYAEFGCNPQFSIEFLIQKWRNLRDTYVRLKNEHMPSGSAAHKKKKWEYFDSLHFLSDTVKYRNTVSNIKSSVCASGSSASDSSLSPYENSEPLIELPPRSTKNKLEGAIIDTLNKINQEPPPPPPAQTVISNPICQRISEMLQCMPQGPRTILEIKLLQVAYDGAKSFLE
ncbi:uncharacterized protein [Diabrotica undecimpunctata]|uniref:uncharacterized protein n=1 Tax=Diabrotica undecimpunctata TaxID=50387 RepID=UPI003B63C48A